MLLHVVVYVDKGDFFFCQSAGLVFIKKLPRLDVVVFVGRYKCEAELWHYEVVYFFIRAHRTVEYLCVEASVNRSFFQYFHKAVVRKALRYADDVNLANVFQKTTEVIYQTSCRNCSCKKLFLSAGSETDWMADVFRCRNVRHNSIYFAVLNCPDIYLFEASVDAFGCIQVVVGNSVPAGAFFV